jgi:RNA polymerase sigma-70 factor (ECF subfamily)
MADMARARVAEAAKIVPLKELGDSELVAAFLAGEKRGFNELVARYHVRLLNFIYRTIGDRERAEDLVQETFLTAWRSIGQVTEPAGFRAWLFSVAHSALVDATRREARKKRAGPRSNTGAEALAAFADPRPSPPQAAEADEQRQRVLRVLRSMPEEYRLPLTLRYLGGADYDTIGRQLGLSNGSLRGLVSRGLAKLRERLKRIEQ